MVGEGVLEPFIQLNLQVFCAALPAAVTGVGEVAPAAFGVKLGVWSSRHVSKDSWAGAAAVWACILPLQGPIWLSGVFGLWSGAGLGRSVSLSPLTAGASSSLLTGSFSEALFGFCFA